jgi:DNA-binding CsgD family transcriptional regulator
MKRANIEDLIGTIYAAAAEPRGWGEVLRDVTQRISGACAALHVHCTAGTSFAFDAAYDLDPAASAEYLQHYHKLNPLIEPLARVPAGTAVGDWALARREETIRSEYYQDYGRRYDMGGSATLILGKDGPFQSCLGIVHGWRAEPFSNEALVLLRRINPHIQRAIDIGRRFETLRAATEAFSGTLDRLEMGVMLLDGRGTIAHANAAAVGLLRRRDGLYAVLGKLYAAGPAEKDALDAAVCEALTGVGRRGGAVAVRRGDGRQPLAVQVAALPEGYPHSLGEAAARAIVFVTDPEAGGQNQAGAILAAYGLTGAEQRVVAALAAGNSVHEAAEMLGISRATARNHLNRALAKTGTGRQAELLRLILSSRVPVR